MRIFLATFALTIVALISVLGLRGSKSTKPPIVVFPDMDFQAKFKPQGETPFFNNQMSDRPAVTATVPRDDARSIKEVFSKDFVYPVSENPPLYTGKNDDGSFYKGFPIEVTNELMALGKKKFNIACSACHGQNGDGDGITKQYGMIATASYHVDRLREMPEGEIFQTITEGKGQMLSAKNRVTPYERWAVIAYVRALQRANNATIEDVPGQYRKDLDL